MRGRYLWLVSAGVILSLGLGPCVLSSAGHYKVINSSGPVYYGHISYIEASPDAQPPVVLREGQTTPETAVVNLPIGPGDIIRTPLKGRCEIQFDTGTIIRLDAETELRVETIMAQTLSARQRLSNTVLGRGRIYIMYKEYDPGEMFQVLTPNAALKMKHQTVAIVKVGGDGSTDLQVKRGKAEALYGPEEERLDRKSVKKMERLLILADSQVEQAGYISDTDFDLWNNEVNAAFESLHEGKSALPKPIQRLPKAVFYFAQKYGNQFGEWLWDDFLGYVWRPYLNQMAYPTGWQPYTYGQWSSVASQLFWVPQEPWGWVPYHLGIWQWDKKLGWVWLPGSLFASAWATWEFYFGYAGWRPLSLYDWAYAEYGGYFGYYGRGWGFGPDPNPGRRPTLTKVGKDQLKKPADPPLPMPKELKGVYKTILAALKRSEARVLDSMKGTSSGLVFVRRQDLNSARIQEKALNWERVPKVEGGAEVPMTPAEARREAGRIYRANGFVQSFRHPDKQLNEHPREIRSPAEARPQAAVPAASPRRSEISLSARTAEGLRPAAASRFRDWNPDIPIAHQLGARIIYSSATNEIRCPELKITSRDRVMGGWFAPSLTPQGVGYSAGPVSSPNSSSPGWNSAGRHSDSRGTGARESGRQGGEGKGKN